VREAFFHTVRIFEGALRLLAPFMPFITEEIWHALYDGGLPLKSIALAAYPERNDSQIFERDELDMLILQDLVVAVRNIRAELKIEPREKVEIQLFTFNPETWISTSWIGDREKQTIERLAGISGIVDVDEKTATAAPSRSTSRFVVRVVHEQKIDVAAEIARVTKELEKLEAEFQRNGNQLGNENFLAKAPAKVVEGLKTRRVELESLVANAKARLAELHGKGTEGNGHELE
jgi:valyl-tRNA synthetase